MTNRACVIGWPIKHSRSPIIHGHWLAQHKIEGEYTKVPVEPETLDEFVSRIRHGEFNGCNVTVPHKENILEHVDIIDEAAQEIGAANTLWMEGDVLHATNTDAYGFVKNLDTVAPGWDNPSNAALVLGAGGAARAVLIALMHRGFRTIHLVNRTRARASELASKFGESIKVDDWRARNALCANVDLIVNTTALGMTGSPPLEIELQEAASDTVVTDLVYAPLITPLLEQASERGLKSVDGLGMLLHQAVPGFEKWFGVRPEVTAELRNLIIADLEQA